MSIVETSAISFELAVPTSLLLILTSVGRFGLGRSVSLPPIRRARVVPGRTPDPTPLTPDPGAAPWSPRAAIRLPSGSPTRHTSPRNGLRDPDRGAPVGAGAKAAGEAAARIVEPLTHLDAPREELRRGPRSCRLAPRAGCRVSGGLIPPRLLDRETRERGQGAHGRDVQAEAMSLRVVTTRPFEGRSS